MRWKVFVANLPFTCNGCTNRHPGCHGKCEKYIREKAEWEQQKALIDQDKEARNYTINMIKGKRDNSAKSRRHFTGYRKSYSNL